MLKKMFFIGFFMAFIVGCSNDENSPKPMVVEDQFKIVNEGTGAEDTFRKIEMSKQKRHNEQLKQTEQDQADLDFIMNSINDKLNK